MRTRWQENDSPENQDIQDEILMLLLSLKSGESICPSDAARAFGHKWRELMPQVREVAAEMVRDGKIEITQRGEVVDIEERRVEDIKGPIRLRLAKKPLVSDLDDEDDDDLDDIEDDRDED